jgi:GAF domain-containing protein
LVTVQRDRIVGRMSCGAVTEETVAGLTVPLTRGASVLADIVLERRSRLVADGSARMLVAPGMPAPSLEVRSFVAIPLVVRDQSVGVVVAARGGDRRVTEDERAMVELLGNQAAVAFRHAAR